MISIPWRIALAAMAIVLAGCASQGQRAAASREMQSSLKPEKKRNPAPAFKLKDVNGRTVQLADYKGKVVILDFWATWCAPCQIEVPWLIEFQRTYKDRGFTVLGVALDDEGWEVVRPFLERKQVNYPVVIGDGTVEQLYGGVESLPTTFVIDREGRIASTHIGLTAKREFINEIEQLLQ